MPLLPKVFGRRDKSAPNLAVPRDSPNRSPSASSSKSGEYVLPDINTPPDFNGSDNGHRTLSPTRNDDFYRSGKATSSSSRLKMNVPGFKRKATAPESVPARTSTSVRESLEPPPPRGSVFTAFGRSSSSQSLPNDATHFSHGVPQLPPMELPDGSLFKRSPAITAQKLPVPKTPEMRTSSTVKIFNRGSKPTKQSDAPRLDLQFPPSPVDDAGDSFNLKSFRPVRPPSPSPAHTLDLPPAIFDQPRSQSPSTLAPPSPLGTGPRPRGTSTGSDNSQRITVAQFRQAQIESAKNRSSVHLPVPEHPSDSMPAGNVPLHMSLARSVSPSPNMATSSAGHATGNESVGDGGTPSRPSRTLPPQAVGRSSPIPRSRTPGASSPIQRPQSGVRPQDGARLSAKWMLNSDSDSNSSDDSSGDEPTRQPLRKPPLIADFRNLKGSRSNSPQPAANSPVYPSSFAASPTTRAAMSASKSDLGHSSSSTVRPHLVARSNASPITIPARPKSSYIPPSSPTANIRPGQYSGQASASPSPSRPSPSVMTHGTEESNDVWSNTHSAVHSRQGSSDQLFKLARKTTNTDLATSDPVIKRSAVIRRGTGGTQDHASLASSEAGRARSLSTNTLNPPTPSSFSAAKVLPKSDKAAMTDTEDEEGPAASSDDDAPLSTLRPPRRPGSGLSSQGSGSPVSSSVTLPLREQSPARSAKSAATQRTRSSLGTMASRQTSLPMQGSEFVKPTTSRATTPGPSPTQDKIEPTSPRSRGRKPLIDFSTSSPTPAPSTNKSSPTTTPGSSGKDSLQSSLLTPPISERGFASRSEVTESSRQESPASKPSSFLRPGPTAVQRNRDYLSRPLARDDSPASSITNSSMGSGPLPSTPRTGSETGLSVGPSKSIVSSSSSSSGTGKSPAPSTKRLSITFDDSVVFNQKKLARPRGLSSSSTGSAGGESKSDGQDSRRNARRRSEARASLELGRVVNGPAPLDPDDSQTPGPVPLTPGNLNLAQNWNGMLQSMSPSQQMQTMAMNMGPATPGALPMTMGMGPSTPGGMPMGGMNMGNPMFNPMMSQMGMGGLMSSPQMFNPMMQNGMQMPIGYGMPAMPQMTGMPPMMMGMDPNVMAAHHQAMMMAKQAYQMAVAQQAMAAAGEEWERSSNMGHFSNPSAAPSMYGMPTGSVYGGSMLGVPSPSVWGGSVYGEPFGPPQLSRHGNISPGQHFGSSTDANNQPRKRTITAPSAPEPPAFLRGAGAPPLPPPSSWRPN